MFAVKIIMRKIFKNWSGGGDFHPLMPVEPALYPRFKNRETTADDNKL